ncbi:Ubiquinone biosynthesis O-methyltransferase [BD1-7 clade bacterium]|uniref:Ubiquinone biosynthesis O-methyltransferase n=1 Tax=BD1-7 clade bacterium TaxID=2029982 RepID=A0A5S9QZ42_9GAMM|nr:Ubiquinone biosynthesis O-methyltransferase [BD1-7 clade bacterium]
MTYSEEFFTSREKVTEASANKVFDVIWSYFQAESVLDVGCATGIWLCEAQKKGVSKIYGIDGPWVPVEHLKIEQDDFWTKDIVDILNQKVSLDSKFDMTICIELAEHLPENKSDDLIEFLTNPTDVVLFSAAVKGQGGTGHVNENTQSYWQKKFDNAGFDAFDVVRPEVWTSPEVNMIYKQNMIVYARRSSAAHSTFSKTHVAVSDEYSLNRVYPELLEKRSRALEKLVAKKLKNRFKKYFS